MLGCGRNKEVEDVCILLKDHLISIIKLIKNRGADSLLDLSGLNVNKDFQGDFTWWVSSFQVYCTDSHKDGVKQIMIDTGRNYHGFQLFAYSDSTDTTTWKMQLKGDALEPKSSKNAKLMYETYGRIYGVQDIKG